LLRRFAPRNDEEELRFNPGDKQSVKKKISYFILSFIFSNTMQAADQPAILPWSPSASEIEKRLGWINSVKPNSTCSGYYADKPSQTPANIPKDTLYLHADKAVLSQTKPSVYTGNVILAQPDSNSEITADRATTELNETQDALKFIQTFDNVNLRQPGILAVADEANLKLPEQTSTLQNVVYRLQLTSPYVNLPARGSATRFQEVAPKQYDLTNASYTTCAPQDWSWIVKSKTMHINDNTKIITAKQTYFVIAGVPLFYTPYLSYSYDNAPKSGFLPPVMANSSKGGAQLGLPFYWYAAPNTTVLFTPSVWTKRGGEFTTDFNYLTWNSRGEFYFDILPYDSAFAYFKQTANTQYPNNNSGGLDRLNAASPSRYYLSWQQKTILNSYWSTNVNINYVSDDYYFQDLGGSSLSQFTLNQLLQQGSISFYSPHWKFSGQLQNYQTLHPVNIPFIADQYARTPQLNLDGYYPDLWKGFEYIPSFEITNFTSPWLLNQPAMGPNGPTAPFPPVGQRLNSTQSLSLPLNQSWGYLKPQIQLQNTFYNLNQGLTPGLPTQINRTVPIFDIDAGLYFDRKFQFKGESYTQTVEPRLFYLYVPNVDQANIPLFDTGAQLFTYNMIFQTNRFTGMDRIGDTNQIGMGVTSRLIDDKTGFNRLIANVGQIFYFANRDVSIGPHSVNDNFVLSPVAGELIYAVNKAVSVTGNIAWNPNYGFIQNGFVNTSYRPDTRHIFNIGTTYQRVDVMNPGVGPINPANNIKQVVSSASWPLTLKLNALAAVTYNLQQQYAMNYLAGLEYDTCCWAIRAVASTNFIGADQNNTPMYNNIYYLQFSLKGFTSLGINQQNNLPSMIPGFVDRMR
jgi:LPS-assembly protein